MHAVIRFHSRRARLKKTLLQYSRKYGKYGRVRYQYERRRNFLDWNSQTKVANLAREHTQWMLAIVARPNNHPMSRDSWGIFCISGIANNTIISYYYGLALLYTFLFDDYFCSVLLLKAFSLCHSFRRYVVIDWKNNQRSESSQGKQHTKEATKIKNYSEEIIEKWSFPDSFGSRWRSLRLRPRLSFRQPGFIPTIIGRSSRNSPPTTTPNQFKRKSTTVKPSLFASLPPRYVTSNAVMDVVC